MTEAHALENRRFWGWMPMEVPWLVGLGVLFHFLAQVHWVEIWPTFVYDDVLRWWLPLIFFGAAAYALLGSMPQPRLAGRLQLNAQWLPELGLPLLAAWLYFDHYPMYFVDDAGFILRYLDHFAEGCFYCFNVEDGPVFGISSFSYGLLAGGLVWSGLCSPEQSLGVLAFVGMWATGWLSWRILRLVLRHDGLVALAWVLVMTCNRSLAIIFNSGMEAPVHVAIVLAAVHAYLRGRDRAMWLWMAAAVISKLDAVPLVVVMALMWTVEHWADLVRFDWYKRRYHDALLYGLVPVAVWIGFATIVFGSPLPQSAFAKVYMLRHAQGHWFPFVQGFLESGYQPVFFGVALALFLAHVGYVAAQRQGGKALVFGFGFIATLLLYYMYNPGERMVWYYVLPEGLMLLQLGVSLAWFWRWLPLQRWGGGALIGVGLCLGAAFLGTWTHMDGEIAYHGAYKRTVERERMAIGAYLGGRMAADDTLQSGHGLNSRPVRGYVVDETGLNFRVDTTHRQNTDLWERYRPNWVVMHGFSWEVDKLNAFPYVLDTTFFDIATYGYPGWRVFRRVGSMDESSGTYFLGNHEILGGEMETFPESGNWVHLKANAFSFKREVYNPREEKLTFGLLRHKYDYKVHVRDMFPGDTVVWRQTYVVGSNEAPGATRICPITIPLLRQNVPTGLPAGPRFIILEFEASYGKVALYDPAISILRRDP